MKSLSMKINESLTSKQTDIVGDLLFQMFENSKLSKESIGNLFKNVDINIIQKLEQYITEKDSEHALAYMSQPDDFLDKNKHEQIKNSFAEYIHKYICNK